jgi:misacylated tRNA(Ala) deacylase
MTELLYLQNSYERSFFADVVGLNLDNNGIILDRTAFYPGGGGQPADFGLFIQDDITYSVKYARKINNKIVHILEENIRLPNVGTKIQGKINWDFRYKLMRTHTAMHILCGVIFRDYGASVTGGNMEPLKGRMDFEFQTMTRELVDEINRAINQEVENARSVTVQILQRDEAFKIPDLIRTKINLLPPGIEEVRVVEIEGLDLQADGGTHVANTSEVGQIQVIDYKSKGKINKRIYLELNESNPI